MPDSIISGAGSESIDETTPTKKIKQKGGGETESTSSAGIGAVAEDSQSVDGFGTMFSPKVRALISQMDDSEMMQPDFDMTAYINRLFPTEQSLAQLDVYMDKLDEEISQYDQELSEAVAEHGRCAIDANNSLLQAQSLIGELEHKVREMREKTRTSEDSVFELTKDIRQLDVAKKNLTESIATLHHLHLLLNGVNSLTQWVANRQYRDIAMEFPAVLNVLLLFDDYQHIEHIRTLVEKVQRIREQLSIQLAGDLKAAFKSGQINQQTGDMCRVLAVLGGKLEEDFIAWFIGQQLAIYEVLYAESEDAAWIDKIEERYRWFVTKLAEFERAGLAKIFPAKWEMGRKMAMEFCTTTRQSLARMMGRRKAEIDWKLLAHAINHTQMFEQLLIKRFPAKEEFNFDRIIWSVFDEHVDVFLREQQSKLSRFLEECSVRIRSGEERPQREAHSTAIPIPSAANMFLLIKKIITESTKLFADQNNVLGKLLDIFRQCLRQFGHGSLSAFLPQISTSTGSGSFGIGGTASILQNFMRDDSSSSASQMRLNGDQIYFTCCILATADWAAETTIQLQEKLRQKISNADLNQESELFYSISNNALSILVQDAEQQCEPSLHAMTKINWSNIEQVGDESPYISTIRKNLRSSIPLIRDYFADRRKYFAHFCLKLASNLVNKFLGSLFKCRPISIAGAEQLLLDTHSLKIFLLNLPSIESSIVIKPPQLYTNTLNKGMNRAEMILKAVMSDMTKPEEYVAHFCRILPDSDANELQRILEMKGGGQRRADQQQIIQIYKQRLEETATGNGTHQPTHSSSGTTTNTAAAFAALTGSTAAGIPSSLASLGDSSMRRLEKLVRKKL